MTGGGRGGVPFMLHENIYSVCVIVSQAVRVGLPGVFEGVFFSFLSRRTQVVYTGKGLPEPVLLARCQKVQF